MSYKIEFATSVVDDLRAVSVYKRREILNRIEVELTHMPEQPTRNKKQLVGLVPPWEHVPPLWELRIGDIRVFYDIDDAEKIVSVRAIRRKPAHRTTGEIL